MNVKSTLKASDARSISSSGVPMGTSRSDSKMTFAGFAVTGEFPSTASPEFGTGVTVASVLAFSSGEVGDGEDSPSSAERTIEFADLDLTSACNASRGLALRLFPIGTTAVIKSQGWCRQFGVLSLFPHRLDVGAPEHLGVAIFQAAPFASIHFQTVGRALVRVSNGSSPFTPPWKMEDATRHRSGLTLTCDLANSTLPCLQVSAATPMSVHVT